jgi:hypothetical protein
VNVPPAPKFSPSFQFSLSPIFPNMPSNLTEMHSVKILTLDLRGSNQRWWHDDLNKARGHVINKA